MCSSALLCIFRSKLLVPSVRSGVNRVQVVLSGFSMRLFCFVQAKVYINSVDERTPPCGTPVPNLLCLEVWFLYVV